MEAEEVTEEEEESESETDEEVEEILEEEEEDKDDENFNSFPTMKELSHHEWLMKNPRPPWIPLALDRCLGEMVFGRPFIDETGLEYNKEEGTVMFKQYEGDKRGVRHLLRLEKEMMDDEGKLTALTWWNSYVMTVGHDVAYAITCANLKKKMTDKYCPRVEMKKLEFKLWNLKVKVTDVIGGFPNMIYGSVVASKPKTRQEAIEMATELMDKKICTFAERQTGYKRKQDDNNNQAQQQPLKKQGVAIAYTAGPGERKEYAGTLPLCNKCKFHHNGQCTLEVLEYMEWYMPLKEEKPIKTLMTWRMISMLRLYSFKKSLLCFLLNFCCVVRTILT
nr:hypothetical protein [Tanacetum cinerariifolium]